LWAAAPAIAQNEPNFLLRPGMPGGGGFGGGWQLGVSVQNTTTGVLLTQVLPGSAAANNGLVVGDRILAVGGHQVGYIDGRLVDLGDEINQHIGPTGQVTLLVHSARTGQVQAGPFTLTSAGGVLRGTAVYQGAGIRLSRNAVLNVTLRDASHNWSGVVVAQTTVPRADRSPVQFQLNYNPSQCHVGHQHVLEAEVVDNGQIVLRTAAPAAVNPSNPAAVAIVLTPFATPLGGGVIGSIPPGGRVVIPYDQINQWYSGYLGRQPTQQELRSWESHIQQGRPVTDIQSYLLGSTEYYDRQRNDPNIYVRGAYKSIYGQDPNAQQMQQWQQRYQQSGGVRSQFIQQMLQDRLRR
jgi:uncharacterized lipoprotein YbaY